ncbi:hypothetical protein M514_21526 [Trichuris suis]|uniref:Reverse transcriptase RNase H-like domain-containing protein n=1 Tax=Trichuris suis TaxID=68888 RepID=A0A085N9U3_9BILA|nr:hypothetical protein M514_21526 [Trichuris suis]
MLAVIIFVEGFGHYLQRKFVLRTDYGSLRWLQSFKNPDGQWARWQQKLQQYEFVMEHRPGRRHANADMLSRIPCPQCGRQSSERAEGVAVPVRIPKVEIPIGQNPDSRNPERYGIPESIHTDQGRQFESEIFPMLRRELGIQKTRTTTLPSCWQWTTGANESNFGKYASESGPAGREALG